MNMYGTPSRKKKEVRKTPGISATKNNALNYVLKNESVVSPGMLYNKVDWTDHNLLDRCTIVLWLYSGMHPNDVKTRIEKGGWAVLVDFAYHPVIYHNDTYRKAIKPAHSYNESDTKLTYFKLSSKNLGEQNDDDGKIKTSMRIPLGFQCNETFSTKEGFPGVISFRAAHRDLTGNKATASFINLELEGMVVNNLQKVNSSQVMYEVDLDSENFTINSITGNGNVSVRSGKSNGGRGSNYYTDPSCSASELKKRKLLLLKRTNNLPSPNPNNIPSNITTNGNEDDDMDGDSLDENGL